MLRPPAAVLALLIALTSGAARAADFSVAAEGQQAPPVERVGPPVFYMKDVGDFGVRVPDAQHYPIPLTPVTEGAYISTETDWPKVAVFVDRVKFVDCEAKLTVPGVLVDGI